jgi:predicted AlkP superfamily phosphohydrolase/phosphomutase
MNQARHRVALELLRRVTPDLFVCVYVLADRIQHVEWSDPPSAPVVGAYRRLDRVVGDYLERLEEGDRLLILSDHGFQGSRGEICLNKIFSEAGLLKLDRRYCWRLMREHARRTARLRGSVSRPVRNPWQLPPRSLWYEAVDWSRTHCAAYGLIGNLMVNLRGRDPRGRVSDEHDRRAVLEDALSAVEDFLATHGVRAQTDLHVVEQPDLESDTVPPDGVLEIDDFRIGTWGGREFFAGGALESNVEGHRGNHARDGVLIAVGEGFGDSSERGLTGVELVMPTMCDIMDLTYSFRAPGRSLVEA